ncbi:MgtC/SapB family protein [Pedococcus sp. P5_B7]
MEPLEIALRLGVALLAGLAVGLEREITGHPAGMRTHVLVAIGAAMFTLTGAYGFTDVSKGPNIDPARIAAQVASGIGFIGAGAILRDRGSIRGLTTASTVWLSAACGVAAAGGAYWEVAIGTAFVLTVLVGIRYVRIGQGRWEHLQLEVEYLMGAGTLGPILDAVKRSGIRVHGIDLADDSTISLRRVNLRLTVPAGTHAHQVAADVSSINGVSGISLIPD